MYVDLQAVHDAYMKIRKVKLDELLDGMNPRIRSRGMESRGMESRGVWGAYRVHPWVNWTFVWEREHLPLAVCQHGIAGAVVRPTTS
jgi:hypothetical protein